MNVDRQNAALKWIVRHKPDMIGKYENKHFIQVRIIPYLDGEQFCDFPITFNAGELSTAEKQIHCFEIEDTKTMDPGLTFKYMFRIYPVDGPWVNLARSHFEDLKAYLKEGHKKKDTRS